MSTPAVSDRGDAGRLDLTHIGVYGHTGGANAVEMLAARDPRVAAVLALDPGLTDSTWATPKPTLLLFAENRAFLSRPGSESIVADIARERSGTWRMASG